MIAALYVATGGCYFGLPGVDPWDAERDARLYDGPWPAVAHPPCERWGRYWGGAPTTWPRKVASANPGYCFLKAGWRKCGVTKWNKLLILERLSHDQ